MRTAVLFLLAAGSGGCGFHAVSGSGDGGDDLGVSGDLAGSPDLFGVPPGSDLSTSGGGNCLAPTLLAGVEDVSNSGSGGGRIARVSLANSTVTPCSTLSGQGLIGSQPMAVAAFGDLVAAATFDGLYAVDPATDTVKWSKPNPDGQNSWGPFDAFSIKGTDSKPYVAAAWGPDLGISGAGIRWLEMYDANGVAAPGAPFCIQQTGCTDLHLSLGIYSMAASPAVPSHFFALDGANNVAALDINPWANPATKINYIGAYSEPLGSIYAVTVGFQPHVAWFDGTMPGGAFEWTIDDGVTSPPVVNGPLKCSSTCGTILHVVPDPSQNNGFFLLCDAATVSGRTVVRADDSGSCSVVLDGAQFGTQSRISRLGIAP